MKIPGPTANDFHPALSIFIVTLRRMVCVNEFAALPDAYGKPRIVLSHVFIGIVFLSVVGVAAPAFKCYSRSRAGLFA